AIHSATSIDDYYVDLVLATRHPQRYEGDLRKWIEVGASPRAGIALDRCETISVGRHQLHDRIYRVTTVAAFPSAGRVAPEVNRLTYGSSMLWDTMQSQKNVSFKTSGALMIGVFSKTTAKFSGDFPAMGK
ncbi:MAG: hypothetical protein AAF497_23055, partial [Planctomycetota bacterium]